MKKLSQITINTGFWIVVILILGFISLLIGAHDFSLRELFNGDATSIQLFFISRLPRLVAILLVGAGLSVSGLLMQTLYHNRFISPTTMGMMDFSKLGILIAMILFGPQQTTWKYIFAFGVALSGTLGLLRLISSLKVKNEMLVPLIGMIFGQIISAFTGFIAYQYDLVQSVNSWLQGSFTLVTSENIQLLWIIIPVLIIIFLLKSSFNIVGLGESFAINLGLNYSLMLTIGLSLISFITASTIITIGSIPFIGLIIGNMVTLFVGDNLKRALPLSALVGASFLLFSDLLSRLIIFPYEVPISITISVFGAIIFLLLITRRMKA